jgi:hypothetical protein
MPNRIWFFELFTFNQLKKAKRIINITLLEFFL